MNLAEAMLAADAGKIKLAATADFEVKRLSNLFGVPFILHLKQISMKRATELGNACVTMRGNKPVQNRYKVFLMMLNESVTNEELSKPEILKHFGAATRMELLEKLLNAGEMAAIEKEINKLCGYGEEEELAEEVKN